MRINRGVERPAHGRRASIAWRLDAGSLAYTEKCLVVVELDRIAEKVFEHEARDLAITALR